jgi:hypothetical protein
MLFVEGISDCYGCSTAAAAVTAGQQCQLAVYTGFAGTTGSTVASPLIR